MPELPLDQIDRNALSNEVGRVAVPETMSMYALFDFRLRGQPG